MPDNIIQLVIQTIDNATSQITGVKKSVEGLGDAAESLRGIFEGVFAAFSVHELVESITDAQEATQNLDRLYATFGDHVGILKQDILDYADAIGKTTTVANTEAIKGQTALLSYTSLTGNAFRQTRDLVIDLAAQMGGDAVAAANDLGRALESPTQGIRLLRQEGIVLEPAQRRLIQNFEETGRTAEAQSYLIELLQARLHGVSDEIDNTLGGSLQNLSNSFKAAFDGQGANVDGLTASIKSLSAEVQKPEFQSAIQNIVSGLVGIGTFLVSDLNRGIENIQKVGELAAQAIHGSDRPTVEALKGLYIPQAGAGPDSVQQASIDKVANEIINSILYQDPGKLKGELLTDIIPSSQRSTHDVPNGQQSYSDFLNGITSTSLDKAKAEYAQFDEAIRQQVKQFQDSGGVFGLSTADAAERAQEYSDTVFADVKTTVQRIKPLQDDVAVQGKALNDALISSTAEWIETLQGGVKGFAESMIDAIKKVFAQALASDIIGTLLGKVPGGGDSGFSSNATGALFGAIGSIFGHAGGGRDDHPFWAGEDGPELVFPGSGGASVMNQRQMAYAGGGGGGFAYAPVHNVTIVSDDSAKTKQDLIRYYTLQSARDKAEFTRQLARNGVKLR